MDDRLTELLEAHIENRLSDVEAGELRVLLRSSPEARRRYWDFIEQHILIEDILGESRGRDLALAEMADDAFEAKNLSRPSGALSSAWPGMVLATAAALLVAFGFWWHADSVQLEPVATVRSLSGDVRVKDPSGAITLVKSGTPMTHGQVLHVGADDSRAEVVFADGTQVLVGSESDLLLQTPAGSNQLHLDRGSVKVQTSTEKKSHLIVTTDHARVDATKTRFRLYREEKASRLELEEGEAQLDSLVSKKSVRVNEGSFVIAAATSEPIIPQLLASSTCRLRHTFLKGGGAVCFSPNGNLLVASHWGRGWKAWDTDNGKLITSAAVKGGRAEGLAFVSGQQTVIQLDRDGFATLWNVGDEPNERTRLRDKHLRHGAVSADGRWLAQATSKQEVAIWEANAADGSFSLRRSLNLQPMRVALSTQNPQVAVSQWAGDIQVFDVTTGQIISKYKMKRSPMPIALSAENHYLAAYAQGDGLVLFDRNANTQQTLWAGEGARVNYLNFSSDARFLLAGLNDGTLRLWSCADGSSLLVLDTGYRVVNWATLSPDHSHLATVGNGDCVKLWEFRLP